MALREIDTRTIPGNGGEVVLWAAESGYVVTVKDAEARPVATLSMLTPQEARDAFLHTFARPDVPDVFAKAVTT